MTGSIKHSFVICLGIACGAWTPILAVGAPEAAARTGGEELTFSLTADEPFDVPKASWTPRFEVLPGPELEKAALHLSFTNFTNFVQVGRQRYTFTEVGSDPSKNNARNSVVSVAIVPIKAVFDDGSVFDPTAPDPCAAGGLVPADLIDQSPLLQSVDYGDGPRQFEEEFRRFEFWAFAAPGARNPGYSVRISPGWLPTATISFHGFPTQSNPCGRLGLVDKAKWEAFVRGTFFPQLRRFGVGPADFVLFLFSNVVFYNGNQNNCCTLGYHSWFNFHGVQTYGVGEYDTNQGFKNVSDIAPLSHEIGEWYDDPLGNNPTPPWGHIGQVSGCQTNFEVGDPLSGHLFAVQMPNGVTYHPQELAFFSWFYDEVPSLGINGWYSMGGTFLTPAAHCR
jgi:hypothetical protein